MDERVLPEGSYALIATIDLRVVKQPDDHLQDAYCELRNGVNFIGSATDRRVVPEEQSVTRELTVTGGAQVPVGGGEVSLWCKTSQFDESSRAGIMIIKIGGFFWTRGHLYLLVVEDV